MKNARDFSAKLALVVEQAEPLKPNSDAIALVGLLFPVLEMAKGGPAIEGPDIIQKLSEARTYAMGIAEDDDKRIAGTGETMLTDLREAIYWITRLEPENIAAAVRLGNVSDGLDVSQ